MPSVARIPRGYNYYIRELRASETSEAPDDRYIAVCRRERAQIFDCSCT